VHGERTHMVNHAEPDSPPEKLAPSDKPLISIFQ
jgi:hypothetical protein